MRRIRLSSLAILCAVPALAQTNATYLLTSSNTVSPSSPTTTIEIWAAWVDPGAPFVFFGANYDLTAEDGQFSIAVNVINGPSSSTGVITGNVISGAANGQFVLIPPPAHPPHSNDNPILLATYDWTTTNFTPRAVDLHTSNTSAFFVIDPNTGNSIDLYRSEFTPGSGVIIVEGSCYADCDQSTGPGVLDIFDFLCFQDAFVAGDPYACDCDLTTGPLVCDIFDFLCFQNAFVGGCD